MSEQAPKKPGFEELKAIAHLQPKADPADQRELVPFRGAFYQRFPEMKAVVLGYGLDHEITYVRMTKERFGIDLEAFYSTHTELCEAICSAVEAKAPYDLLVTAYAELTTEEAEGRLPEGSAQQLLDATEHPRGLDAIGLYYWDQLNPLLEQAYSIFDAESLNAPFLGR